MSMGIANLGRGFIEYYSVGIKSKGNSKIVEKDILILMCVRIYQKYQDILRIL